MDIPGICGGYGGRRWFRGCWCGFFWLALFSCLLVLNRHADMSGRRLFSGLQTCYKSFILTHSELSMQRKLIGLIAGLACRGAVTNIAQAAEQKTVESLYQDKAKLGGHEVQVRGKVVKVNNGVMKRNFLHIQDGTGKLGSNDLTVTSQVLVVFCVVVV